LKRNRTREVGLDRAHEIRVPQVAIVLSELHLVESLLGRHCSFPKLDSIQKSEVQGEREMNLEGFEQEKNDFI
jgi:hypothetical protein